MTPLVEDQRTSQMQGSKIMRESHRPASTAAEFTALFSRFFNLKMIGLFITKSGQDLAFGMDEQADLVEL